MSRAEQIKVNIDSFEDSKYLEIISIRYCSGFSEPYLINITAEFRKTEVINSQQIVGKKAAVTIFNKDNKAYFNGIVTSMENMIFQNSAAKPHSGTVKLVVEPDLALLKKVENSRVFPKGKVTDIIKKVVEPYDISIKEPSGQDFINREFTVQYNESDFDFIHRLMEEEGIFYYFTFDESSYTMVLGSAASDYSQEETVSFSSGGNFFQYSVLSMKDSIQAAKVVTNDYDGTAPKKNLLSQNNKTKSKITYKDSLVDYKFPYYVKSFEKNDDKTKDYGKINADLHLEALQTNSEVITLNPTPAVWWRPYVGNKIKIDSAEKEYVIKNFEFFLNITEQYESISEITAIDSENVFRPLRNTPVPDVPVQTAVVIGTDSSSELFVKTEDDADKNIFVKIKFHWDIVNKDNSDACSCWIRAGQPWSGNGRGFIFVPRVGDEVVVAFEYGHPDRPVIIGSVNNGTNTLPYSLKKNRATSAIVGKSTPNGSSSSSALVFVDDKDKEQVALLSVGSFYTRIKKERFIQLGDSTLEYIKKDVNITADGNSLHKIKGEVSMDIGKDINIKSGGKVNLEASEISLKVGGNFIKIDASGVMVSGAQTKINSGGSGNEASVTAPKELPDDLNKVDSYKMVKK